MGTRHDRPLGERRGLTRATVPLHDCPRGGAPHHRGCRGGPGADGQERPDRQAGRTGGRHRRREVPQVLLKEAPQLAELVKAGNPAGGRAGSGRTRLPSSSRCSRSASTAARGAPASSGPADYWNGFRCCSGPDHPHVLGLSTATRPCRTSPRASRCRTAAARASCTLRRGMKWSDGKPVHRGRLRLLVRGHLPEQGPDSHALGGHGHQRQAGRDREGRHLHGAVQVPRALLHAPRRAGRLHRPRPGQASARIAAWAAYAPAHYLKQFHPKYVGEAELDKKVKEAKFDSWVRMFLAKNDWALNPELPVVSPWKTVTADQHADVDARAEPVQRLRGHGRATSCPTSTGWC